MAAHARLKIEFTEDEKYQNLMSWLIILLGKELPLVLYLMLSLMLMFLFRLTLICRVDFSILINWTSPFLFLGVADVLFSF